MAELLDNMGLLDQCDRFPSPDADLYPLMMRALSTVFIPSSHPCQPAIPIGYMRDKVLLAMMNAPEDLKIPFHFDAEARTVTLFHTDSHPTPESRTDALNALSLYWRSEKTFKILKSWRNEPWPVYGPGPNGDDHHPEILFTMDRTAIGLLGATRYGVHMIAYTLSPSSPFGIKIWIPTRSATKSNWPGMLDNTVAGGLMAGEDPLECLIREADEEASLPADLVRERVKPAGMSSYIYVTDEKAGGEDGWIYPEVQWVYDLELPADVVPKPQDGEAERFDLWDVDEVKRALSEGKFKPNCALIHLDFFVRWGIMTKENGTWHVDEIRSRAHRVMPFPGPHREWEKRKAEGKA